MYKFDHFSYAVPIIREFFIEVEISEFKKCVLTLVCANLEFFQGDGPSYI